MQCHTDQSPLTHMVNFMMKAKIMGLVKLIALTSSVCAAEKNV